MLVSVSDPSMHVTWTYAVYETVNASNTSNGTQVLAQGLCVLLRGRLLTRCSAFLLLPHLYYCCNYMPRTNAPLACPALPCRGNACAALLQSLPCTTAGTLYRINAAKTVLPPTFP